MFRQTNLPFPIDCWLFQNYRHWDLNHAVSLTMPCVTMARWNSLKVRNRRAARDRGAARERFPFALTRQTEHPVRTIRMRKNSPPKTATRKFRWWFSAPALCTLLIALPSHAAPRHVYLTWQGDTSRTMTINYQTFEAGETSTVRYDTKPRQGRANEYRYHATGQTHEVPGLADGRKIHWVELSQLTPGKTYYFIAGDPQHGFTEERKFRTIPSGTESLRFVIGGDMGFNSDLTLLLKEAAKRAPAFGIVGGDIAYADDRQTNFARWDIWLDNWETNMVTPAGLTIPMVLAIGNHEVRGGTATSPTNALFYLRYFGQNGDRTYYSRTFGKNLAVFLLDTGHLARHEGEQAAWLAGALAAHRDFPTRFAAYHVPLYPSVRAFDGAGSVIGRKIWMPIFDQYHLTTAFEHHDHAFKRTPLLRENQLDPNGTLYLGDGCWGMAARKVDAELRWYEAKAASIQHFWCVDVNRNNRVEYRAVSKAGEVFDVYPTNAAGAKAAEKVYQVLSKLSRLTPSKLGEKD